MIHSNECLPYPALVASAAAVRRRKSVPIVRHLADAAGCSVPALLAAVLGFFVITLDAVIVNVALPSIQRDLRGGMTRLQWVVDGYTLMFATLLLSAGALSDRIGARRAFGAGLALFVAASATCGLAPNLGTLIVARFVQGGAAAVIMPTSMALMGQEYSDPVRHAHAVAVWAMGGAVASSSGPVLGGLLTLITWRMIFFINLPMTAGQMILAVVPSSTPIWILAMLMVLVGLAGPLVTPPIIGVLLNSVPGHRAGTASALPEEGKSPMTGPTINPQHVFILGAGLGLSASIARRFGRQCFEVTLVARREQALGELAAQLRKAGITANTVIAGGDGAGTPIDLDRIANTYRALHLQPVAKWSAETVFGGQS